MGNDNAKRRARRAANSASFAHALPADFDADGFWRRVDKTPGCWNWMGTITEKGYGRLSFQYVPLRAHRVSFVLAGNTIPEGTEIDHTCRNRRCVNPAHLEAVPPRENTMRGFGPTARNARKTHCPKGHPYTGEKLNWQGTPKRYCIPCEQERERRRYLVRKSSALALPGAEGREGENDA